MTSLAFVIPVLNDARALARLLPQLEQRFPDARRLVVDGGSTDDSSAVASANAQLLTGAFGRARQMNLGAAAAESQYLIFLHADSGLTFAQSHLQTALSDEPQWGFCPVRLVPGGGLLRLVQWSMNQRSRLTRVATGDQMLFVRRDVFEALDGFADIPLMEDVELCKRLRRRSAPRILQTPVETSSRRWQERGILRTVLQMWGLRLAYVLGVSPGRLHRMYYGA